MDKLYGGAQHGTLFGISGSDCPFGGHCDDDLCGGQDADRLVFQTAVPPEENTIHDFDVDLDTVVICSTGGITLSDFASGVDIVGGLRLIHVLGVNSGLPDSGNLLLPTA